MRRGAGQRREEADHDGVRDRRRRHRLPRGPGGDAVPADLGPDRAPPHAQARPSQPARPAAAGRPAPPAAELPFGYRHHPLPLADRATGPAPVARMDGSGPPGRSPHSYGDPPYGTTPAGPRAREDAPVLGSGP